LTKWLKLTTWVRLVTRTFHALRSPHIPLREKALLLIPAVLYWVLPDVLPFLPVDDIAVTLLLANWFTKRIENKYPPVKKE
jgi:uncharacterized membrane protein YkvA (DUF1232 family)